jgi:hypothetical protein
MTKTEIAKLIASAVTGWSTSTVIKKIIENNVTPDSVTDKAALIIGSHVLGAIAASAAKDWTDEQVQKLIDQVNKLRQRGDEIV